MARNNRPDTAPAKEVADSPLCQSNLHKKRNEIVFATRFFNINEEIVCCCDTNHLDLKKLFPKGEAFHNNYLYTPSENKRPVEEQHAQPVTDEPLKSKGKPEPDNSDNVSLHSDDIAELLKDEFSSDGGSQLLEEAANTPLPVPADEPVEEHVGSESGKPDVKKGGKRGRDEPDNMPEPKRASRIDDDNEHMEVVVDSDAVSSVDIKPSNFGNAEFVTGDIGEASGTNTLNDGNPSGRDNKKPDKNMKTGKTRKTPLVPKQAAPEPAVSPPVSAASVGYKVGDTLANTYHKIKVLQDVQKVDGKVVIIPGRTEEGRSIYTEAAYKNAKERGDIDTVIALLASQMRGIKM